MIKTLFLALIVLFFGACSTKRMTVNGLICPEGFSTHQVQKDLTQCQYYDEKKAAEASHSPIKPACIECLETKGYQLEE